MPRVPEYQPDVSSRPIFQSGVDVRATSEAFGAPAARGREAAARGLSALGEGVSNLADAAAHVQKLQDETVARDARNKFMVDADEAMYGQDGFTQKAGKAAIDAYPEINRKIQQIRRDHAATLTPAQQAIFNRAVDVDELQRKRTAIIHRGNETRKFVIETHEAGATSFLEEAVRTRRDAK
jgi:hypothetical protein